MTKHIGPDPADYRRAAALIAHYGNDNVEGINAVFADCAETKRTVQMILAILSLYDQLIPEIRTEFGMKIMSSEILRMAQMEVDQ